MQKTSIKDLVVVLPGITGSVLQKDGRDIWAAPGQAMWRAVSSGLFNEQLRLASDDSTIEDLGDGIRATSLITIPRIVAGFIKCDGYGWIREAITHYFSFVDGGVDERPGNYFEFPYDWRRDNRYTARLLKDLIDRRLPEWREFSGARDAKVILLAHSMGGLVSRYYTEVLEGWTDCRALITLGTPFRGSVNALEFLSNGYKGLLGKFIGGITDTMRSFPSMYQLMPIYSMLEVDGQFRRVAEMDGIPGIVQSRAEQALRFHREIEEAVGRHRNHPQYLRSFRVVPVVGTRQPTLQSVVFSEGRINSSRGLPLGIDARLDGGDGTVPRLSAIPNELSEDWRAYFIPERHSSLQRNSIVLDWLCEILKQAQIQGYEAIRGPQLLGEPLGAAICLDLDDLFLSGTPIEIKASIENINSEYDYGSLCGTIEPVSGAAPISLTFRRSAEGWVSVVEVLGFGIYRIEVRTTKGGQGAPSPVHDVFEVAEIDNAVN